MPGLAPFTGALRVKGAMKIRPVDLVATDERAPARRRAGRRRVLDRLPGERHRGRQGARSTSSACATSMCPAWLATPGMGAEKIAQYYDDPQKRRSDAHSFRTSIFAKRVALGEGLLLDRVPLELLRRRARPALPRASARSPRCRPRGGHGIGGRQGLISGSRVCAEKKHRSHRPGRWSGACAPSGFYFFFFFFFDFLKPTLPALGS